jgi:predicted RNase H-like nuclease
VLTRYEDEVDGIVCAHLAWLWERKPESLYVYGSLDEGYIVAPPPPAHPPLKPPPAMAATSPKTPDSHPRPLRKNRPAR